VEDGERRFSLPLWSPFGFAGGNGIVALVAREVAGHRAASIAVAVSMIILLGGYLLLRWRRSAPHQVAMSPPLAAPIWRPQAPEPEPEPEPEEAIILVRPRANR
jgi:hypothetical protein